VVRVIRFYRDCLSGMLIDMQNILQFYRNLWAENHRWLRIVTTWFILSAFVGAFVAIIRPDLLQTILASFAERFGEDPSLNFDLALQIFLQNIVASLIALFGGLILGLGSFMVVVVNGFLIGFVVSTLIFLGDNIVTSLVVIAGGLLPHGIIELPAFLVASAIGLRLGIEWLSKSSAENRFAVLKHNFLRSFGYIAAIALALFIAAIIEVFVSGKIVENL
jgi:stage II sporulation protein M